MSNITHDLINLINDPDILLVPFERIHLHIKELMENCTNNIFRGNKISDRLDLPQTRIDYVLTYLHDHLNIGKWDEVPEYKKQAFTAASFIKAISLLPINNDPSSTNVINPTIIKDALKIIDKGFLLGLPLSNSPDLLTQCAALLTTCLNSYENQEIKTEAFPKENTFPNKKLKLECHEKTPAELNKKYVKVDIVKCPSIEDFYNNYFSKEQPVVIQECMSHWPAMTKWHDVNYLLSVAGERTVPIELGSSYSAENFSQKLMTLREFINKYYNVDECQQEIGYLAQHDLLTQIPQLQEDIRIPEYCCTSRLEDTESNEEPEINAWFGPGGTVSTLHYDPKDNLLCQVYGAKKLLMFAPGDSQFLYPHEGMLCNTSQVDPVNPDLKIHTQFASATMYTCSIHSGEMIYIPPKWWHHVTALDKSFSVNFWWK